MNFSPIFPVAFIGTALILIQPQISVASTNPSHLSNKQRTIATYAQAKERDSEYASDYLTQGNVRYERGDKQGAIADYTQAIRSNPNYAEAYANRGLAHFDLGNMQEALADLQKAANLFLEQKDSAGYEKAKNFIESFKPVAEINTIARDITVLINGQNPGSGVIVAREGDSYYVLTAKHVVKSKDEYKIVTSDGEQYKLNYSTVKFLPGAELALLQFTSHKNYRVATLSTYYDTDYSQNLEARDRRYVFVYGWPAPWENQGGNPLFTYGLIEPDYAYWYTKDSLAEGYNLSYTNITYKGMSGGPVLDANGRVIAIHGQLEGEEIPAEQLEEKFSVKLGNSVGIAISTFLKLAPQSGIKSALRVENSLPSELNYRATEALQSRIKVPTDSSNAIDWINYGNNAWRLNLNYEGALQAFDRAISINEDFYPAWYARGFLLDFLERYEEAVASYDRAIASYDRAIASYDRAIASYDRAIKIKRGFYEAWRFRGLTLYKQKRYEEAFKSFDEAVKIKQDYYLGWFMRGVVLLDLKRYEEAFASFDKAVQIKEDFYEAWFSRGSILNELDRNEEALASYEKVIQLKPDHHTVWYNRGWTLAQLGRYEEALQSYDKSIQLSPDNYYAWFNRGKTLAQLGRYKEAIESLDKALEVEHSLFQANPQAAQEFRDFREILQLRLGRTSFR